MKIEPCFYQWYITQQQKTRLHQERNCKNLNFLFYNHVPISTLINLLANSPSQMAVLHSAGHRVDYMFLTN